MVRRFRLITGLLLLPGCGGPPQPTLPFDEQLYDIA